MFRRIYCDCAGFGQIFRSFSLNRPHYSPQTIEKSDSNQHTLATIANLGQAPSKATIDCPILSPYGRVCRPGGFFPCTSLASARGWLQPHDSFPLSSPVLCYCSESFQGGGRVVHPTL